MVRFLVEAHARVGEWIAAQSMDNQILTYSASTMKLNRAKRFGGHVVAGYGCQLSFSPDAAYLASGDSEGAVWFWDWKSGKGVKRSVARGVVLDVAWSAVGGVACAAWDSNVYLLE